MTVEKIYANQKWKNMERVGSESRNQGKDSALEEFKMWGMEKEKEYLPKTSTSKKINRNSQRQERNRNTAKREEKGSEING